jgi:hypothetical protein
MMLNRSLYISAFLSMLFPLISSAQTPAEKAESIRLKLRELDSSISAPEYVGRNVDSDLAAIQNLGMYRQHLKEVATEFSSQIKTGGQPYANLGYTIDGLTRHIEQFDKAAREYSSLKMIQADLDHMLKMAKQAVEYQAPAYFLPENDISLRTEAAKVRMKYLEAFSPGSGELKSASEKMAATIKEVAEIQKSLSAKILEQNSLPPDAYQQADREALIKLIQAKWEQSGNKSKILKVGIVGADWNRNVSWELQNRSLYKVDRSRIQGYVIVAHDAKLAVRHSINLTKDHIDKDKISLSFLNDPKAQPELVNQILLSKVK